MASDVLGKACRAQAWQLSDDQVDDALAAALAVKAHAAAVEAVLVSEADVRSLRARTQALSTHAWLGLRLVRGHAAVGHLRVPAQRRHRGPGAVGLPAGDPEPVHRT